MKPQTSERPNPARTTLRRSGRQGGSVLLIDLLDNAVALTELHPGRNGAPSKPPQICELPRDWSAEGREEESGRWLSGQIEQYGFRARRALVLIARSMLSFRTLETPRVPDDELIPLLELQAETQSLTPFADLQWTYVRGAEPAEAATLHPLLMTAPRRRLDPLLRAIELAGLDIEAVMPRTLALAASNADAAASRTEDSPDVWLIAETGDETEILLTSAMGEPIASQSIGRSGDGSSVDSSPEATLRWANAVASKWNQCAAALPDSDRLRSTSYCRLCIAPSREPALREALRSVAGLAPAHLTSVAHHTVEVVNAASGPSGRSLAVLQLAALGCLQLLASGNRLPDLSNPPQVAPPRPRRWRLAAGLAAALAIAAWWSLHAAQSRLDRQVQTLRQEERQLSRWIERGESVEALSDQIEQWNARQVDARAELAEFLHRLPDDGEVVLSEVALSSMSDGCVQLRARGASTSADAALQLNERMLATPSRYELQPHPLRKSRRNDAFPVAFEIEAEVEANEEAGDGSHDAGHAPPPAISSTR